MRLCLAVAALVTSWLGAAIAYGDADVPDTVNAMKRDKIGEAPRRPGRTTGGRLTKRNIKYAKAK
jgi:hypothetical protein